MICPKCKIAGYGTHCKYCGEKLTEEIADVKEDVLFHDTARITPVKKDVREAMYSDEKAFRESDADSEYYNTDKDISPYSYYEEKKDSKKVLIGVFSLSAIVLFIICFIVARSLFAPTKRAEIQDTETGSQSEKSRVEKLYDTAGKYMKIDDFENAEAIYKEIYTLTDDEEALLMYDILSNYNEALRAYEEAHYESAMDYYEKIPVEYIDYDISQKVDKLCDNIENGLTAYEIFENIKNYMANKDYEAAEEETAVIEDKYLSKEDGKELEQIKKEIEKINKDKKEFTSPEAESFLQEYCYAMEKATNAGDFSLVSKYLDASAYLTQKDAVDYCVSEGIVKKFGSLRIKSLNETKDNTWEASVSESETVTFDNGTEEIKSYSRIYTIEYINSAYYITSINGD